MTLIAEEKINTGQTGNKYCAKVMMSSKIQPREPMSLLESFTAFVQDVTYMSIDAWRAATLLKELRAWVDDS